MNLIDINITYLGLNDKFFIILVLLGISYSLINQKNLLLYNRRFIQAKFIRVYIFSYRENLTNSIFYTSS